MIIGNGLLAKAFAPYFSNDPDVMVFASGVSNSRETQASEYAREREMLIEALGLGKFTVYFSSCSVHDPELTTSPYVLHKLAMEKLLGESGNPMAIFRLPQVVGSTPNPFTLTNYLNEQIVGEKPFQVWLKARRNLIDAHDVATIGNYLVRHHESDGLITNIACPFSITVLDLVGEFERALGKKARYNTVDAGGSYPIDASLAVATAAKTGIRFDEVYVKNLIRKYYA